MFDPHLGIQNELQITTEADEVRFDLCNVTSFFWKRREGCAV